MPVKKLIDAMNVLKPRKILLILWNRLSGKTKMEMITMPESLNLSIWFL